VIAQPRQRKLHLHTTLGAHELVPLVDDDEAEIAEDLAGIVTSQEQRE
jgi:hypothetical protein